MNATNTGFTLNYIESETAAFSERIELREKAVPSLKSGELLVKILSAPVNPSDLVYLMGKYGIPPAEGLYAGFEACGIVVDANAGFYGRWLKGKRVAVFATPGNDGVWAKYCIVKSNTCIPVRNALTNEQAASLLVNPCTSVCLVERALKLGAKTLVLNAAASQVGKGVIRYAKTRGLETIATVRSQDNISILNELGASYVLHTQQPDYLDALKLICHKTQATVFLDAVADQDTPNTLSCMPHNSTAIVYGRLTETHHPYGGLFSVSDLIFRNVSIEGFWLAHFFKQASIIQIVRLTWQVQNLFAKKIFNTDVYGLFGFKDFPKALEHYAKNKSDGKVFLTPDE